MALLAAYAVDEETRRRLEEAIAAGRARLLGTATSPATLQSLLEHASDDAVILIQRERGAAAAASEDRVLTPRELDVLAAMADGASNKAIARRLGISFHTVKFHVAAILAKLDADTRTEAVLEAARLGLVML